jgi:hypothetical protein
MTATIADKPLESSATKNRKRKKGSDEVSIMHAYVHIQTHTHTHTTHYRHIVKFQVISLTKRSVI